MAVSTALLAVVALTSLRAELRGIRTRIAKKRRQLELYVSLIASAFLALYWFIAGVWMLAVICVNCFLWWWVTGVGGEVNVGRSGYLDSETLQKFGRSALGCIGYRMIRNLDLLVLATLVGWLQQGA